MVKIETETKKKKFLDYLKIHFLENLKKIFLNFNKLVALPVSRIFVRVDGKVGKAITSNP